jgi:hypothetical protein
MSSKRDAGPEGFSSKRDAEPDGFASKRDDGFASKRDDDVEGHSMMINPGLGRDLAKARSEDVDRAVRSRQHEAEAKRPFRK